MCPVYNGVCLHSGQQPTVTQSLQLQQIFFHLQFPGRYTLKKIVLECSGVTDCIMHLKKGSRWRSTSSCNVCYTNFLLTAQQEFNNGVLRFFIRILKKIGRTKSYKVVSCLCIQNRPLKLSYRWSSWLINYR